MLTLPEHLLLIALHDEKGTVHPAAYLALDSGLRGAVLAELRLQGRIQTGTNGQVRRHPSQWGPTQFPVIDDALDVLGEFTEPHKEAIADLARIDPEANPRLRNYANRLIGRILSESK